MIEKLTMVYFGESLAYVRETVKDDQVIENIKPRLLRFAERRAEMEVARGIHV